MSIADTFEFIASPSKKRRGYFSGLSRNKIPQRPMQSGDNFLNTRSGRPGIPSFDYSPSYTNRLWLSMCYWYEEEVSIFSDILQKIRDEVTRYGIKWTPAFAKKCNVCGTEFQEDLDECDVCHSKNLREPDKMQLRAARVDRFHTILERANMNKQRLSDVVKSALFHMLVTDNGYILIHKDYVWDINGNVNGVTREFFALDPRDVIKLFDFETGFPGKGRVCLDHRSSLLGEKDVSCPICGKPTFRAHYQVFTATKTSTYYIEDEICHLMYYYPGIIYGYPKAMKINDELISYHMIEKRVRNFYEFCKVPALLFIPNDDPEALREMWQKAREGTKDDPFTPAVLGVSETAPTTANLIKLMQDPNADLIAVKDDLRMRIASALGVNIAFTNDTGQSGGLKNDKNAISLSDRTIRSMQELINSVFLKEVTISLNITDWILECEPNVNENLMEKEELRMAQITNMERLAAIGVRVRWLGDRYTSYKGEVMSPEMIMMGMGGGEGAGDPNAMMPGAMPMGNEPPMGGMPMSPDELGNPNKNIIANPGGLDELDALASGNVDVEEDSDSKYNRMLESISSKKNKTTKRKVSTKLSKIIDEMFLSFEDSEKILDSEEDEEEQEDPGLGMNEGLTGGMNMQGMDMQNPQQPPGM